MTIFKQYDSRWGKKNYNGSSTISAAACGPFSVANLVVEYNPNIDPMEVVKYMQNHGYAIRNNGTAWAGIPAAMKAFGLEDVKNVSAMSDVWKYLAQGYVAVFLFKGGSRGGVCWTTAGHYVAVTGFKTENGNHKCYTKDSGGRNHDGWYCYETQMKGLISQVWVGKPPGVQPKPAKDPATCIDVSEHQGSINWANVNCNYAVIRAGYGKNNIDKHFVKNISEAIKAGKKVGVYWFSYAYTVDMAKKEAEYCIAAVRPYKLDMPIFFDFEYDSMNYAKKQGKSVGRALLTEMTKVFMDTVKAAGYNAGFYYNYDYKANHYNMDALTGYYHWYALYSSEKQTNVYMQQYSSKGKVNGISGNVDINWLFGATPGPAPAPWTPYDKIAVDGAMGPKTIKKMQLWLGVTQDGVVGPATTKALQRKVGATVDGIWGSGTTKKLQKFLNKNGASLKVDGARGKETIKALQRYLNKIVKK